MWTRCGQERPRSSGPIVDMYFENTKSRFFESPVPRRVLHILCVQSRMTGLNFLV